MNEVDEKSMSKSMVVRQFLGLAALLVLVANPGISIADSGPGAYAERKELMQYADELVREHGFDRENLTQLFQQANYRDDIVQRMQRPAEKVWTWARYKKHLVDQPRIDKGAEFMREHADTLARAEEAFRVAPEIVTAIIGIETRFGQIKGNFPVLDALLTLGFDYPPRASFFRKELTQFLLLAREEGKDPRELLGSYAGAMGYGQFIPSSYRHYAVDFDGDSVRDIWDNPVDAIGSVANYFARHRWQGEHPRAVRVAASDSAIAAADGKGLKLNQSVAKLLETGLQDAALKALPGDLPARVYALKGEAGPEYWVALPDFYVITRYNHSHLYALAVHHLAEGISAAVAKADKG